MVNILADGHIVHKVNLLCNFKKGVSFLPLPILLCAVRVEVEGISSRCYFTKGQSLKLV
uniref:Uncharacterized protein n=1 Tax=Arundo donax TaxID=35708 RepID=A0A0A9C9D1_ARUDO